MNQPITPARSDLSIAADTAAPSSANALPVDDVVTQSGANNRCAVLYGQFGRARSHVQTIVEIRPESPAADAATAAVTTGRTIENDHPDSLRAFQEKADLFEQLAADWKSQLARIAEVHRHLKDLQVRGFRGTSPADDETSMPALAPIDGSDRFASGIE